MCCPHENLQHWQIAKQHAYIQGVPETLHLRLTLEPLVSHRATAPSSPVVDVFLHTSAFTQNTHFITREQRLPVRLSLEHRNQNEGNKELADNAVLVFKLVSLVDINAGKEKGGGGWGVRSGGGMGGVSFAFFFLLCV